MWIYTRAGNTYGATYRSAQRAVRVSRTLLILGSYITPKRLSIYSE